MKKLVTLLLAVFLIGFTVSAQYYYVPFINIGENPGAINNDGEYPVGGGLDASWTPITTGNNSPPIWSATQTIPFNFTFNGLVFTQYKVSTSGILTFDIAATAVPPLGALTIPNASIPDNSICVWGLESTGANDQIVIKTFGTAPYRQYWVFFASYNWVGGTGTTWTYWSIVLEETTNNVYIVDQRTGNGTTALTLGLQFSVVSALQVAGSPTIANNAGTNGTPADNSYYMFVPGTQLQYDFAGNSILTNDFLGLNSAPFDIVGSCMNMGSETITNLDVNYKIDNGTTVTANLTGLSIAPFDAYTFTHPTQWNPGAVGTYDVTIWVSNLNGNADQFNANDEFTKPIQVVANFIEKKLLHEVFTSATCPPCVGGNIAIQSVLDANPGKWTCVKYQMDWPGSGDIYYDPNGGGIRKSYYGVTGVPNLELNGDWNSNPNSYDQTIFDQFYNIPAFMEINAVHEITGQDIDVEVTITPHADFPPGLKLHIVVVENQTTGNVGSNGETEFFWVEMKMVPDGNGTAVGPFTTGNSMTYLKSASLASTHIEEMSDLSVVVFVQEDASWDVYQSTWSVPGTVGIEDTEESSITSIYPNPANSTAFVNYNLTQNSNVTITIHNMLGEEVYSTASIPQTAGEYKTQLDLNGLSDGVYFLKLQTDNKTYTQKLVIN